MLWLGGVVGGGGKGQGRVRGVTWREEGRTVWGWSCVCARVCVMCVRLCCVCVVMLCVCGYVACVGGGEAEGRGGRWLG